MVADWEPIGAKLQDARSIQTGKWNIDLYSDMKLPGHCGNIFYRLKQDDFNGEFTL